MDHEALLDIHPELLGNPLDKKLDIGIRSTELVLLATRVVDGF
jgi:hypothetical protein